MRKIILTAAALTLICGSAFAQSSTGPAAQGDNMNKPGTTTGTMDKGSMNNGAMTKGSMNSTTGMSADKNDPKKELSKDGSPSDGSKEMKK